MSLADIYKSYQEMLHDARADRWDKVQNLEAQLNIDVRNYFASIDASSLSIEEEDIIKKIQKIHLEVTELAMSVKQEFINVVAEALNASKAMQKYEKHKNL